MTREETKKMREFAFAFATLLAIVSRIRLWRGHDPHLAWFFGIGGALAFAAIFFPSVLRPLYRGWTTIARGLLWFNTRLLLSIVFFLVVVPIGFILRLAGRDPLERRFESGATSYWKKRPAAGEARVRFRRQF